MVNLKEFTRYFIDIEYDAKEFIRRCLIEEAKKFEIEFLNIEYLEFNYKEYIKVVKLLEYLLENQKLLEARLSIRHE